MKSAIHLIKVKRKNKVAGISLGFFFGGGRGPIILLFKILESSVLLSCERELMNSSRTDCATRVFSLLGQTKAYVGHHAMLPRAGTWKA